MDMLEEGTLHPLSRLPVWRARKTHPSSTSVLSYLMGVGEYIHLQPTVHQPFPLRDRREVGPSAAPPSSRLPLLLSDPIRSAYRDC